MIEIIVLLFDYPRLGIIKRHLRARFRQQLSAILEHVAQLQALDTSDIPPTSSVLPPRNVLRADEPRPGLSLADLLANAPQVEAAQFRVPPILE